MANIELLERVLKTIEADPVHWKQHYWRSQMLEGGTRQYPFNMPRLMREIVPGHTVLTVDCETAFCVAGWACELSGEPTEWQDTSYLWPNEYDQEIHQKYGTVSAFDRGRRVLGLTNEQASYLFEGDRSLYSIKSYIEVLKRLETQRENRSTDPGTGEDRREPCSA